MTANISQQHFLPHLGALCFLVRASIHLFIRCQSIHPIICQSVLLHQTCEIVQWHQHILHPLFREVILKTLAHFSFLNDNSFLSWFPPVRQYSIEFICTHLHTDRSVSKQILPLCNSSCDKFKLKSDIWFDASFQSCKTLRYRSANTHLISLWSG